MPREEEPRMTQTPDKRLWLTVEHTRRYLDRAGSIPHREEGEAALLEFVPAGAGRILDLGAGGGRLVRIVRAAHPAARFVGLDFSPPMLEILREQFSGDPNFSIVAHDMAKPLPPLGLFDCVVSSFAIHHLTDERKRALYGEIYGLLAPGGAFLNLEHVASPTEALHGQFLRATGIGREEEDPENILASVETQVGWLREIGLADADCHWKWRELALFGGLRPSGGPGGLMR